MAQQEQKVRILHFSPHNQGDGIAKYQEQYVTAMAKDATVENKFFDVTPIQLRAMNQHQHEQVYDRLREELGEYDILHIQHEFGLYVEEDFQRLVSTAKDAGKKVVITIHLAPQYAIKPVKLGGVGPRSLVAFLRQKRHYKRMVQRHIVPFRQADVVIAHNASQQESLVAFGINPDRIQMIMHPVYDFPIPPKTDLIAQKLNKKSGDIIYCTVGILHAQKGLFDAVRALKFLPGNYKLAIIGGMHPIETEIVSETLAVYNKLTDLIDQLGLHDRVYITGFVEDDNLMNAYIRECDACVYPYDGIYYANASSGAVNLGLANERPIIAYPTRGFSELAALADGALVLTQTFAYYELARSLQEVDMPKQARLSRAYAKKMAWPNMALELVKAYHKVVN